MTDIRNRLAASLAVFALCGAGAPACAAKQKGAAANNPPAQRQETPAERQGSDEAMMPGGEGARGRGGEMKVLAEGSYGESGPFVAVARGPRVYAALRALAPSLPELSADFFKTNAVAAVFLGQRNTGGHAVEISHEGGGRLRVAEHAPPSDGITTQVITHPFQVVAVPAAEGEAVSFVLEGGLAAKLVRPYRVTAGEVAALGGRVRPESTLGVARHDALLTVLFDLRGAGGRGALVAAATGTVVADGRFSLEGVDPRALPGVTLSAAGRLAGDGERLEMTFESPAGAAGRLEAVATGPAPVRGRPGASTH